MPENTAFKQQRLPAWQPVLTAKNVLPTFVLIGLIFVPLGVVLLLTSNNCYEQIVDYTECENVANAGQKCHEYFNEEMEKRNASDPPVYPQCFCDVEIDIERDVEGPVYYYYRLTNFYQNHRIYVKSRDNAQLAGKQVSSLNGDCQPYDQNGGKNIAPCGTIANSLFNDTFKLTDSSNQEVVFDRTQIAWKTDHTTKFNNPLNEATCPADEGQANNLTCQFQNTAQPPFWKYPIDEVWKITNFDKTTPPKGSNQNGYENQPLEVWMRTAAFPTFRKLYGIVDGTLANGTYTLRVEYNYPVVGFKGTKSFVIAQMTWAGGKNPFLGIAYIVVGSMALVSAVALLVVHRTHQKRHNN